MTQATGTAEREAAKIMIGRTVKTRGATVGADRAYDVREFVHVLRKNRGSHRMWRRKQKALPSMPAPPDTRATGSV